MFNFGVSAQTGLDKPLNPQQIANLVTGLKGVLQENLAIADTGGKKYTAITQKWNARKDLAGKSKTQAINLLYEDVKSVIADPGTQYQISSIFSLYKQMPDEQFSGQTQPSPGVTSKADRSQELVDLTFGSHPYVGIEAELAKFPGSKDVEAAKAEDRKNRIEGLEAALKVNDKLTADQKTFVRASYDQLIKITDKITEDAISKNFPTKQWIKEGLQQSYSKNFTAQELGDLVVYFQGSNGRQVLKYIRRTQMQQLITGNSGKPDFTAADKAEYNKFAATAPGKKFIKAYITETEAYEKRREDEARSKPDADGFAIYEPENLNKLFNKFVADNYKK